MRDPQLGIDWQRVKYACWFAAGVGFERFMASPTENHTVSGGALVVIGLCGSLMASKFIKDLNRRGN